MMSLSWGKSHQAPNKLESPHSTYVHGVADTDCCMTYNAFKNKMKTMAADLQGDDAVTRLVGAKRRFLGTAFEAKSWGSL